VTKLKAALAQAVEAADSLGGKRFGLLVASSLVATTAIIAAALTSSPNESGPLAGVLARSLTADPAPVAAAPAAEAPEAGPEPAPAAPAAPEAAAPESLAAPEAAPAPEAEPATKPQEPTPAVPPAPTPEAGQVKHVFVISLSSPGYDAAFGPSGPMPYLSATLRPQGQLLSEYSLIDPSGLPNAIGTISGQPPNPATKANCATYSEWKGGGLSKAGIVSGSGCLYPVEVLTLADQLVSARFKWHAYVEGMVDTEGQPDTCVQPEPNGPDEPAVGAYAARANPFVYFHSLLDLGDCTENDVPFAELEKDLAKIETTPNFSYIAPSLCNAGVPGQCPPAAEGAPPTVEGPAAADAYLAQLVPKILASPAYKKDGLLIVSFGEAPPPPAGTPAPAEPLKTGALLLSRFVGTGTTDTNEYTPYSLLKSTEELFGLEYLGKAGSVEVRSFGQALRGGETLAGD
jgi:phosphatidylinositol-3-phosphatase